VAKVLGDVVLHHDADGDVHQRNEVEQNPPGRLAGDLAQHDDIIDRDDARPTRLARLFNTFHKLAISNTTRTAQTIQNIGPGPSTGGENVSCIGGTPG